MTPLTRFFATENLQWHKAYWSGVLVGAGFTMQIGGFVAMRYRIDLNPGLIAATGCVVFVTGIIVARQTMKSAGES